MTGPRGIGFPDLAHPAEDRRQTRATRRDRRARRRWVDHDGLCSQSGGTGRRWPSTGGRGVLRRRDARVGSSSRGRFGCRTGRSAAGLRSAAELRHESAVHRTKGLSPLSRAEGAPYRALRGKGGATDALLPRGLGLRYAAVRGGTGALRSCRDLLAPFATAADKEGEDFCLRIGPSCHVAREVSVTLGPPRYHGVAIVASISWRSTGLPALFPVLEGDLGTSPSQCAWLPRVPVWLLRTAVRAVRRSARSRLAASCHAVNRTVIPHVGGCKPRGREHRSPTRCARVERFGAIGDGGHARLSLSVCGRTAPGAVAAWMRSGDGPTGVRKPRHGLFGRTADRIAQQKASPRNGQNDPARHVPTAVHGTRSSYLRTKLTQVDGVLTASIPSPKSYHRGAAPDHGRRNR